MGGEKYLPCFNADGFVGSPPRWRGKAVKFRCTCGLQRITPAWAGKSKLALCTPSCPTDHPRAGREKNKELEGVWLPMGSPPRRRGKERSTALVGTPTRITPALAGKSYVFGPFRPGSWDHPRVGGEKQIGGDNGLDKQGSPPRGRGKGCLESFLATTVRITPAWAGKSMPGDGASGVKPDHPRVGGEKKTEFFSYCAGGGSPPRGRGKDMISRGGAVFPGITPAWAGKSSSECPILPAVWDHPRVGGEKLFHALPVRRTAGSPPRGRGKAPGGIPSSMVARDHPRVGGEKAAAAVRRCAPYGSPPRGRGKAIVAGQLRIQKGITPAWAGKRLKRSHRSGIFISGPIPFHSVLHRPAGSGGSRAGRDGSPAGQPQNAGPA